MAHLTHNKLLITIPSLARPGMSSIMLEEPGKEKADHRVVVVLPKGSFINGKDVSLYTLNIKVEDLDPIPPLPNTHCFYVVSDRFIILSRGFLHERKQGQPAQRIREVRCRAFELQHGIMQACRLQRPVDKQWQKEMPDQSTLLENLTQRAKIAKLVSQYIGHRR